MQSILRQMTGMRSVLLHVLALLATVAWPAPCLAVAPPTTVRITRVTASATHGIKSEIKTLDGDLKTGWSVHGDGQWVCYELSQIAEIRWVAIAWAAGDERKYRFDVLASVDGGQWRKVFTGVSNGETNELERHRFDPAQARFVKIVGHGSDENDWVNVMEVEIDGAEYVPALTKEMRRFQPPTDTKETLPFIYAVTARPSPRPTLPQNTVDGDPRTGWSAQEDGQWLTYHLSCSTQIGSVAITWACPHEVPFGVRVSQDGRRWKQVLDGNSQGVEGATESYEFDPVDARYLRFAVCGSVQNHWHRLTEVKIGDLTYRPTPEMQWWSRRWESGPPSDEFLTNYVPAPKQAYSAMAAKCVETLIENGTDRYGDVHAPIWVLNLDLETMECFPQYNDALIEKTALSNYYSPTAPYGVGYRAIRGSQRESGCSNLFVDQPMIRAALLQDLLAGEQRFTPSVKAYVRWYFENLMDKDTGLLEWGVHNSYDVFDECLKHGDGDQHEVHCLLPMWPLLYEVAPEATIEYLQKFWYWHTDPATGIVDRHTTRGKGLDFSTAAGEVILVCAFLHTKNPDGPWLGRALKVAHAHWDSRDPNTDLFVNTPHGGTGKRFDNTHSDTSVTGYWASRVLMAGRLTGNDELTGMARDFLQGWAKYGWDAEANKPWASLCPDGTPNTKPRDYTGTRYDKFDPSSHWDFWMDYAYGFEAPFATISTYAMAAKWLDDPVLKSHAVRLAECYRELLPANGKHGTFAANYGQLISFFLAMEDLTGDASYRATAEQVADEAAHHLWTGSLLRGFAGRTHYTAIEGVGFLVQAFAELDADPENLRTLRKNNMFLWNH